MDSEVISVGATRLRHRLVAVRGGIRHWAANEKARRNLRAEIDGLDRTGLLDDVLRDLNMTRSDVGAISNADPETPFTQIYAGNPPPEYAKAVGRALRCPLDTPLAAS